MLRNLQALDHDLCMAHLSTTAPQKTLWPDHHIEFNAVVMEYRRGYHLERWTEGESEYGLSMPTQISILAVCAMKVLVAFSGGRSSAMMLHMLMEKGEQVDACCSITRARNGQKHCDFVQECSDRWGAGIVWLEYDYIADRTRNRQ